MRYVAAYMLAVLGGKTSPSQNDIEKILSSVGIETDAEKLKKVITELNGKSMDELVAKGMSTHFFKHLRKKFTTSGNQIKRFIE